MNPPRPYDWSRIRNLEIRGVRRICHARVEVAGKTRYRSLHIEADPAGLNAPHVIEALRAFKLEIAKDHHAILQLTRSRNEHSTCKDLFLAYEKACRGRDIQGDTVSTALSRLRHVVRAVKGEFFDIDAARTSIFTRDLAQEFEAAKIGAVKDAATKAAAAGQPWTPEDLEQRIRSAGNSAKSCLQQARQLFARRVLDSAAYRLLVLPDLKDFLGYRIAGSTISAYVPPPLEVWQKILADLPALKAADVATWFAFHLAGNCGLRRSSARNARWQWCVEQPDGSASMRIGRAKGNHSTVSIEATVWAEMKAARASLDFIIPGTYETPKARAAAVRAAEKLAAAAGVPAVVPPAELARDEVIDRLVHWLRGHGVSEAVARTPVHMLRKIYGDQMRNAHGIDQAQKALGHSSPNLTNAVYSHNRATKSVRIA